ncbi:hypothetical protein VDF13_20180, partial [Xanthomonas campestris pv. raphani]
NPSPEADRLRSAHAMHGSDDCRGSKPKVPILTTTPLTVDVGAPCPMCTHLHAVRRRLISRRFG